MNKKDCKAALDIYKKFLTRMDQVSSFLKVAEDVGFDKDDIPDLSKVCFWSFVALCILYCVGCVGLVYMHWSYVQLINLLQLRVMRPTHP